MANLPHLHPAPVDVTWANLGLPRVPTRPGSSPAPSGSGESRPGTVSTMPEFIESKPEVPPLPERDLAEDEPDLLSDAELEDAAPTLPPLDTAPADPMVPVPPGPETTVSPLAEAGGVVPQDSLDDMADAVQEGRLPGD